MPLEGLDPAATLLVVDVQTLTLPNARSVPVDALLGRIGRLADVFRMTCRGVTYAVSSGTPAGRTDLGPGARSWPREALAVADAVRPGPDEDVHERAAWSAFAGTTLANDLRRRGSTQVVVVGLATTFGIESTVRTAYDLGLDVVVVTDAVSGPDLEAHERAVRQVFPLLAVTTTTDALLTVLQVPGT
jgi:nicotinamidase-related amidase